MVIRRLSIALAIAVAGCMPDVPDGVFSCEKSDDCPDEMQCFEARCCREAPSTDSAVKDRPSAEYRFDAAVQQPGLDGAVPAVREAGGEGG